MPDPKALLERVTDICLALPEATVEHANGHAMFSVGKKRFAYFLNDHHGDGIIALSCRLPAGENTQLVEFDPARFYLPAYTAHNGWIALRLDVGEPDWDEARTLAGRELPDAGAERSSRPSSCLRLANRLSTAARDRQLSSGLGHADGIDLEDVPESR